MIRWTHELPSAEPGRPARLAHLVGWLPAAETSAWFERVLAETPLAQRTIKLFGREVLEPRLTAWVGDPGAAYTYSGRRNEPLPFPPSLAELRARLEGALGARFDAALVNLYRSGDDAMGMHADDEPELGPEPVIASLSLGAARTFRLRRARARSREGLDLRLGDGDLLVMGGRTQEDYRHGVPREAGARPRLNITFRWIRAPRPH